MGSKPGRIPGPGRPKGSENEATKRKKEIRRAIEAFVYKNQDDLINKLAAEPQYIRYLMDQAIGKPKDTIEVDRHDSKTEEVLDAMGEKLKAMADRYDAELKQELEKEL